MLALDLMGAGEGLSTQTIMVRVRKIDTARLRDVINAPVKAAPASPWGAAVAPALALVDRFPKLAIDAALPIVQKQLEGMGVTADLAATDAPPPPRPPAETATALGVGAVLGILIAIGGRWAYHRIAGRK